MIEIHINKKRNLDKNNNKSGIIKTKHAWELLKI